MLLSKLRLSHSTHTPSCKSFYNGALRDCLYRRMPILSHDSSFYLFIFFFFKYQFRCFLTLEKGIEIYFAPRSFTFVD